MPRNMVIKELFSLSTALILLIVGGYYFFCYLDRPHAHPVLISETELSKGIFVYCIEFESLLVGTDWYQYYLSSPLDRPISVLDKKKYPFLEGNSRGAEISVLNASHAHIDNLQEEIHLSVRFSGKIRSFFNTDHVYTDSKTVKVKINLIADNP